MPHDILTRSHDVTNYFAFLIQFYVKMAHHWQSDKQWIKDDVENHD